MVIPESYCLQFQAQTLPQTLKQLAQERPTGHWSLRFPVRSHTQCFDTWYLTFSQEQVVFSGNQPLTGRELLKIFQRYLPRFRTAPIQAALRSLESQMAQVDRSGRFRDLLNHLQQMNLVNSAEAKEALWLQSLSDCDRYLFERAGAAQLLPSASPQQQMPIAGFALEALIATATERQVWWRHLQSVIPSMDQVPSLNLAAVNAANLSIAQQQRLQHLVSPGKTLNEIAIGLAQDSLETAKVFARLIHERLVTLQPATASTEVYVVDDSPLLLRQFENLVLNWGYAVHTFEDPATALQALSRSHPGIVFLDINMPHINGFELVKHLRRQPHLAEVPLVMLTAEKTLSNNWRSRLSGCRFLSKPLTPDEIPQFQMELRRVLAESVPNPLTSATQPAPQLNHHYPINNHAG